MPLRRARNLRNPLLKGGSFGKLSTEGVEDFIRERAQGWGTCPSPNFLLATLSKAKGAGSLTKSLAKNRY